jgi:hypothetical protein
LEIHPPASSSPAEGDMVSGAACLAHREPAQLAIEIAALPF